MKINLKKIGRKRLLIGLGVGAVIIIIIIVNLSSGGGQGGASQGPPIAVQVEEVRPRTVEQTVTAAGKIQPVFETEISSTVSAQIMAIYVEEGYEAQPGDTLVILDRRRYEASHERAQSGLRSARAGLKKVTAERDRGRQLYEKNLISLQEMETLEASYEEALSRKEQAEATLAQASDDLDKTVLLAPESGVVTKIRKEVGEMALGSTFQADVLLVISDLSMMEVVVEVDETDVVDIELMDPVKIEVDAIQDTVFEGRVSRIAHSALVTGQGTQEQVTNFEVVVTLDVNPLARRVDSRIRPGMSATATITTALHTSVVAAPIQALTARVPIRKESEDLAAGEPAEEGREGNQSGARGAPRGGPGRGGPGPPGAVRMRGPMGSGPGGGGAEFTRPEPVEVVFVVAEDTTGSGGGFLQKLFGSKPSAKVDQREVIIGISSDTHYEILSGLEAGEEIVVGNYQAVSKDLQDGRSITRRERRTPGRPPR
ncbi:MAG: efflux RND transporter periplasmic adaptor subunit [Fidelibacterota bacterium]|nr:MAG: efflux RND transporter periplasmic adaptor subunit [Candidatus Neomarinimicrobiota bacterium]